MPHADRPASMELSIAHTRVRFLNPSQVAETLETLKTVSK
jgi:hypothetical protein